MIPAAFLLEGAKTLFVDSTLKVALVNNTGTAFTYETVYDDVEPYIIPDGTAGYHWQDLSFVEADLYFDGYGVTLPNKNIVFPRDSSSSSFAVTGAVVLREDDVDVYTLVSLVNFDSAVNIQPGQGTVVVVQCGYDG